MHNFTRSVWFLVSSHSPGELGRTHDRARNCKGAGVCLQQSLHVGERYESLNIWIILCMRVLPIRRDYFVRKRARLCVEICIKINCLESVTQLCFQKKKKKRKSTQTSSFHPKSFNFVQSVSATLKFNLIRHRFIWRITKWKITDLRWYYCFILLNLKGIRVWLVWIMDQWFFY